MLENPVIQNLMDSDFSCAVIAVKEVDCTGARDALRAEHIKNVLLVRGFYKSGEVYLYITLDGKEVRCISRYGTDEGVIHDLDDLARINARWWESSRDRWHGWEKPDEVWLPHLLRLGLVRVETRTVYLPVNDEL
jgi:hypothetical protein